MKDRILKQQILPLDLPPAFEDQGFIVSSSNEEAYLWLMRWPNWPTRCLALYGEEGCGKTHLSHIWQRKTKATRFKGTEFNKIPLTTLLEAPPFFILDEAHCVETEGKLFHLYNHIVPSKGGLLLLAQTPPAHWTLGLPDLRSRLNSIPAVKIHSPDEELLARVIQKLFFDLKIKVDESVIHFLLKHIERSFESACHWVNLLNTHALTQNRRITILLVREILLEQAPVERHLESSLLPTSGPSIYREEIGAL